MAELKAAIFVLAISCLLLYSISKRLRADMENGRKSIYIYQETPDDSGR